MDPTTPTSDNKPTRSRASNARFNATSERLPGCPQRENDPMIVEHAVLLSVDLFRMVRVRLLR